MIVATNDEPELREEALESYFSFIVRIAILGTDSIVVAFRDKSILIANGDELVPLDDPDEIAAYVFYRASREPGFVEHFMQALETAVNPGESNG